MKFGCQEMTRGQLEKIINKYGNEPIYHITGGEPSLVKWLYPFIEKTKGIRFHLNTNAFILPPNNIKRLKVSLDTNNENEFDNLVQVSGAFKNVIKNIEIKSQETVTSITCVLNKQNYKNSPDFIGWCRKQFPNLYAVFFSCYKGKDENFLMTRKDANIFFDEIKPNLENEMDEESKNLLNETIEEKFRLIKGCRFPENNLFEPCYLSMSERVFDFTNKEYHCSHLYRDGVKQNNFEKHKECLFGCNRRLVMFNEQIIRELPTTKKEGRDGKSNTTRH
jgi:MoaA/NifB/PqqE/SkfB family radical SAM enzyme